MRKRFVSIFLTVVILITAVVSPAMTASAAFTPDFEVNSKAAYLVNMDTGAVLYEKNATQQMYPASLTKIMTAIIVLEQEKDLNRVITASSRDFDDFVGENVSTADFRAGEQIRVIDLLYGLLLPSACEAANILADYYGGGDIQAFVAKMNEKAKELGATSTHFANPHGLYDPAEVTTAEDMYKITTYALTLDPFKEIVSSPTYEAAATNMHPVRTLTNTNSMMFSGSSYYYAPVKGIKTGTTDQSGKNLVSMASKGGFNYMLVALDAPVPAAGETNLSFVDTKNLYEWAFNNFSNETVLKTTDTVGTTKVRYSSDTDTLQLSPAKDVTLLLPKNVDISSIQQVLDVPETVEAPVQKGDVIGKMELKLNNETIGECDVVAAVSVSKNFLYQIWDIICSFFSNIWVQILFGLILAFILFYILLMIVRNKSKRRRGSLGSGRRSRGNISSSRRRRR